MDIVQARPLVEFVAKQQYQDCQLGEYHADTPGADIIRGFLQVKRSEDRIWFPFWFTLYEEDQVWDGTFEYKIATNPDGSFRVTHQRFLVSLSEPNHGSFWKAEPWSKVV